MHFLFFKIIYRTPLAVTSCNHYSGTKKISDVGVARTLRADALYLCSCHFTLDNMGKCKFNENWLSNQHFSAWLKLVPGNVYEARCILC